MDAHQSNANLLEFTNQIMLSNSKILPLQAPNTPRKSSLKEIIARQASKYDQNSVESYQMDIIQPSLSNSEEHLDQMIEADSKIFVVTRLDVEFSGMECELLNFKDMTAFARLNKEKSLNKLLKTLNASVSHDMLNTIGINIELAQMLFSKTKSKKDKRIIKLIIVASKMVLLQANDLIDHRILEHGALEPRYQISSAAQAIDEIIKIARYNKNMSKDQFVLDVSEINNLELKFDRQRLQ